MSVFATWNPSSYYVVGDIVFYNTSDWKALVANINVPPVSGTTWTLYAAGGGVTSIVAGTNVTISPISGVGAVTINASGGVAGVTSLTAGTGVGVSAPTGAVTISNTGVISNVAGTGIGVSSGTGTVTISNTGVTSAIAGTGIGVSGTGTITISNTGVTSITAGTGIGVSASTGGITISNTSPGTWVGTATSDLNMNGYSIVNSGPLTLNAGTTLNLTSTGTQEFHGSYFNFFNDLYLNNHVVNNWTRLVPTYGGSLNSFTTSGRNYLDILAPPTTGSGAGRILLSCDGGTISMEDKITIGGNTFMGGFLTMAGNTFYTGGGSIYTNNGAIFENAGTYFYYGGNINSSRTSGVNYLDLNAPPTTGSGTGLLRIFGNKGNLTFDDNVALGGTGSNQVGIYNQYGYMYLDPYQNVYLGGGGSHRGGEDQIRIHGLTYSDSRIYTSAAGDGFYQQNGSGFIKTRVDYGAYGSLTMNGYFTVANTGTTTTIFNVPSDNNQSAWYNNGTGNFGIGTSTPDYRLTVNGTIKAYDTGNDVMGLFSPTYGNYLHIGAWDTTGWAQKNIVLNQFGGAKVGICKTDPGFTLDVAGSFRAETATASAILNECLRVGIQGVNDPSPYGIVQTTHPLANTGDKWSYSMIQNGINVMGMGLVPDANGKIIIGRLSPSSAGANGITIDTLGGFVGLGQPNPAQRLDVVGNAAISGYLTLYGAGTSPLYMNGNNIFTQGGFIYLGGTSSNNAYIDGLNHIYGNQTSSGGYFGGLIIDYMGGMFFNGGGNSAGMYAAASDHILRIYNNTANIELNAGANNLNLYANVVNIPNGDLDLYGHKIINVIDVRSYTDLIIAATGNLRLYNISNIDARFGGRIISQTNSYLDIVGANNGVGALRLINGGAYIQANADGTILLQPDTGKSTYVNGTMTFYQTSGTPLDMNGNIIKNANVISAVAGGNLSLATSSQSLILNELVGTVGLGNNKGDVNLDAGNAFGGTTANINLTAGTNINLQAPVTAKLQATQIRQPVFQQGTAGGTGPSGSVSVTIPVAYASYLDYQVFVTHEGTSPANTSVGRVSATSFTIYWTNAGGGAQSFMWMTAGI